MWDGLWKFLFINRISYILWATWKADGKSLTTALAGVWVTVLAIPEYPRYSSFVPSLAALTVCYGYIPATSPLSSQGPMAEVRMVLQSFAVISRWLVISFGDAPGCFAFSAI